MSIEACPIERTKRSRFGQIGSRGSDRRISFQSTYATGAIAIGVPGWPELAAWTASIESVRIVLTDSSSSLELLLSALFASMVGRILRRVADRLPRAWRFRRD